jgi:hypothetical protein
MRVSAEEDCRRQKFIELNSDFRHFIQSYKNVYYNNNVYNRV